MERQAAGALCPCMWTALLQGLGPPAARCRTVQKVGEVKVVAIGLADHSVDEQQYIVHEGRGGVAVIAQVDATSREFRVESPHFESLGPARLFLFNVVSIGRAQTVAPSGEAVSGREISRETRTTVCVLRAPGQDSPYCLSALPVKTRSVDPTSGEVSERALSLKLDPAGTLSLVEEEAVISRQKLW